MQLSESQLKKLPVFGIAGNFAEHLGQAGEDADFINIPTKEAHAPKGIFPIYIPNHASFLGTYPLSHDQLQADFSNPINVQMEPELCMLFDVHYDAHHIADLTPVAFTAFNDCSIRRPNATKISQKKNWGRNSTGIAKQWIELNQFDADSDLDHFQIASYLKRHNAIKAYGVDSEVRSYSYFYQPLVNWLCETFNTQTDLGPLENLANLISKASFPKQLIISLGATRYTALGEKTFLAPNDQIWVFIYNPNRVTTQELMDQFQASHLTLPTTDAVGLIQTVSQVDSSS